MQDTGPASQAKSERSKITPSRSATIVLLCALAAGIVHVAYYAPFLSDDALISLRYADRLVDGHGLTWTDGERVEGYSDMLWIVLCAGFHAVGFDLIMAARLLAALGMLAALWFLALDPKTNGPNLERTVAGSLGLALCAPAAVWTVGALEHGMMVGVIVAALALIIKSMRSARLGPTSWTCAGLLCSLVLLRVDGAVLVFGMVLPVLFFKQPGSWKKFLLWSLAPALVLLAAHLFRYGYYGEWVPNTALAKVAINPDRLWLGIHHVASGLRAVMPVLLACGLAFSASFKAMRAAAYAPSLSLFVIWMVYLILVGGDIFPGWRQLLLGLAPVYFLFAQSLCAYSEGRSPTERRSALLWSGLAILLGLYTQTRDSENVRAKTERWEFDGLSIGPVLKQSFGAREPLLAVDAAGALPYWSELPSLDMLGLNDSYIAHHPPEDFGHGGIGHELGDGAYVLSRRPDLVAFNNAAGFRRPMFLSGRQMVESPEFRRDYTLMRLQGNPPLRAIGEIFVRKDGKVGFTKAAGEVVIPGYLMSEANAVAQFVPPFGLVTPVSAGQVAAISGLYLRPGTHRLRIESEGAPLGFAVRCDGRSMRPVGPVATSELLVEARQNAPLSIVASTTGTQSIILRVVFEAVPGQAQQRCSNHTVRTTFAQLRVPKEQDSPWNAPGNVVFSQHGLEIGADGAVQRAARLLLSVDGNDTYRVVFFHRREQLGDVVISPRANSGGLATHEVAVPGAARDKGFDRLRVHVMDGDGAYSLGHLIFR